MADVPACIHRGHVLTGTARCYCRHAHIRRVVGLGQCATCPLIAAIGTPSPPVHAIEVRRPPTPDELPCIHRSPAPVRTEPCKSCSNHYGLRTIDVYGCSRHSECTLPQSEVLRSTEPSRLAKWCASCKDRTPAPPSEISSPIGCGPSCCSPRSP